MTTSVSIALLAAAASLARASVPPQEGRSERYTLLERVGVNTTPPVDLTAARELLPFGWFKNFTNWGRPQVIGDRRLDYVPVLFYTSQADTPEFLEQFGQWIDQGLVPLVDGATRDDALDQLSLERLRGSIRDDPERYPEGMLFQLGNEPGYSGHHLDDRRTPAQIVADARIVRGMLDGLDRGYRLALGGISTPRYDFVRESYRGRDGFEFWEEILELAEPELFDAFVIHPYPSDMVHPTSADLRAQVLEARRLLARFGHRDKDLIAGETGIVPRPGVSREAALRYCREAIEFYLTARDPEIGHRGDGGMLVQRFCWVLLEGGQDRIGPGLDAELTTLRRADGSLSALGVVFRDAVEGVIAAAKEE